MYPIFLNLLNACGNTEVEQSENKQNQNVNQFQIETELQKTQNESSIQNHYDKFEITEAKNETTTTCYNMGGALMCDGNPLEPGGYNLYTPNSMDAVE